MGAIIPLGVDVPKHLKEAKASLSPKLHRTEKKEEKGQILTRSETCFEKVFFNLTEAISAPYDFAIAFEALEKEEYKRVEEIAFRYLSYWVDFYQLYLISLCQKDNFTKILGGIGRARRFLPDKDIALLYLTCATEFMALSKIGDAEWFALTGLQCSHHDTEIKQMLYVVYAFAQNQQGMHHKAKRFAMQGFALESKSTNEKHPLLIEYDHALANLENDSDTEESLMEFSPDVQGQLFLKIAREKFRIKEYEAALRSANYGLALILSDPSTTSELEVYRDSALYYLKQASGERDTEE